MLKSIGVARTNTVSKRYGYRGVNFIENQWLHAAKRLHALAETGKQFTQDEFDLERYREIADIAVELLASLATTPINIIVGLVNDGAVGYATPKVDVRGAVFHNNKILLVREQCDGLWALPGGYADVGLSPSENIEKEILEEAGLKVKAKKIFSIRHKAKGEYDPDILDYYKLFFLCEPIEDFNIKPGFEVSDADYFGLDHLPPLSTGRVVKFNLMEALAHDSGEVTLTSFD